MTISPNRKRVPIGLYLGLLISSALLYAIIHYWRQSSESESDNTTNIILLIGLWISVSYVTILAFLNYTKLIFDKNASLTLTDTGFIDNLGIASVGFISWTQIVDIKVENAFKTNFLVIRVTDPQNILDRQNLFKRRMLQSLLRRFGSPIAISQKIIDYDVEALKDLLIKKQLDAVQQATRVLQNTGDRISP